MTSRTRPGRTGGHLRALRLLPAYVAFGLLKHVVPLPRLARWAYRSPQCHDAAKVKRAKTAVTHLSRWLGATDRDCLQRSLVLYRELSRVGATPTLVLGFARETSGAVLSGHAWVEDATRSRSVLSEDVARFSPAMAFGRGGDRLALASPEVAPARNQV